MLIYVAHPKLSAEPKWVAGLAAELATKPGVTLYRPWIPRTEQLRNPDLVDDLSRGPRPPFFELRKILSMREALFGGLEQASSLLLGSDQGLTIASADADLYCLMRSDVMLVDLGVAGYGEQGMDVLFGRLGGMPIIGITNRFQNAPSLLARLDCVICPDSIGQIARVIELFIRPDKASASSESDEPSHEPIQANPPRITREFAEQILVKAGAVNNDGQNDHTKD